MLRLALRESAAFLDSFTRTRNADRIMEVQPGLHADHILSSFALSCRRAEFCVEHAACRVSQ